MTRCDGQGIQELSLEVHHVFILTAAYKTDTLLMHINTEVVHVV